jgi:TonB family protein
MHATRFGHSDPQADSSRKLDHATPVAARAMGSIASAQGSGFAAARLVDRNGATSLKVEAGAPQARLIFRGETHALPFERAVVAGTEPELIEISAPGHTARHYLLTVAGTLVLDAMLSVGSGVQNISESEYLGSRRLLAPPPAIGSVATNTPATTNLSGAIATSTGAASHAIAMPAGAVDSNAVNNIVRAHYRQVVGCGAQARAFNPNVKGRVSVNATVDQNGRVLSAHVASSEAHDARLESCVVAAFRGWQFPSPSGGTKGTINFTFNFE